MTQVLREIIVMGKPWVMVWASQNPYTGVWSQKMVVQSKRSAKTKRSHSNKRKGA